MSQSIGLVSIVVRDYDEALRFYIDTLGFRLIEDTPVEAQKKRWVVVAPVGSPSSHLLLARAVGDDQASRIGNQTGDRVFLFLYTDDFWRDFRSYRAKGVVFVREPKEEPYGTVAVFEDLYGNLWDLLQPKLPSRSMISCTRDARLEHRTKPTLNSLLRDSERTRAHGCVILWQRLTRGMGGYRF